MYWESIQHEMWPCECLSLKGYYTCWQNLSQWKYEPRKTAETSQTKLSSETPSSGLVLDGLRGSRSVKWRRYVVKRLSVLKKQRVPGCHFRTASPKSPKWHNRPHWERRCLLSRRDGKTFVKAHFQSDWEFEGDTAVFHAWITAAASHSSLTEITKGLSHLISSFVIWKQFPGFPWLLEPCNPFYTWQRVQTRNNKSRLRSSWANSRQHLECCASSRSLFASARYFPTPVISSNCDFVFFSITGAFWKLENYYN